MKKLQIYSLIFTKKTVFSFMISFVVLYLLIKNVSINSVVEVISTASFTFLFTAFVLHYFSFIVRGKRWQILLSSIGIRIKMQETSKMVFLSWFINSIVPAKLGDIYRSYLLKKSIDSPISESLGTIFVERIFDILTLLILLSISGGLIFKNNIPHEISQAIWIGYFLLAIVFCGMIFLWVFKERLTDLIPLKFHYHYNNLHNGVYGSFSDKKVILKIILLTFIAWLLEASRFMLVTKSLNLHIGIEIIILVVLAASLLTAIPLTPAGLGAVEITIVYLLGIFGTDATTGTSIALLDRIISYWSILITGTIVYIHNNSE